MKPKSEVERGSKIPWVVITGLAVVVVSFIWVARSFALEGIGPSYVWHTFYGGSNEDSGGGIAIDHSGNIYIGGSSKASWQGEGGANPIHGHSGNRDLVVMKLDSKGAYQWHTFYETGIYAKDPYLAIDGDGNIYIIGNSNVSWQGDGGASPLHAHSGDYDVFVLKLSSHGTYQWHTFYGSSTGNYGYGIALDDKGNVYVTGSGPTWQGDGDADPLHTGSGGGDIFVLKLTPEGAYEWHTFYGPTADGGHSIAVDGNGNVYVTGQSLSSWQGAGGIDPLHGHTGQYDIVLLKLNSKGVYQWHTFYGGGGGDSGDGVGVDANGNVYVTGYSTETWQGDGDVNPIHAYSGGNDIFVLKLNERGDYQWHTFYGGVGSDWPGYNGIAVDRSGNVYVTGGSSQWQGDGGSDPLTPYTGGLEIFLLHLDSNGAYRWHTFYGSGGDDYGWSISTDKSRNIYLTGGSKATWQGDGNANPLHAYSSDWDIVVLKLSTVKVRPQAGTIGTEITITGSGFGTRKSKVLLDKTPLKILEWTDGTIRCSVPKALQPGLYDISIQPWKADPIIIGNALEIAVPEIETVNPISGLANDEITITGLRFGTKKGKVTIGGKNCMVKIWTMDPLSGESQIRVIIPKKLGSGTHELKVTNGVGSDSADFTID